MKAWFVSKRSGRVVEVIDETNKYVKVKYFPSGSTSLFFCKDFEKNFIELPVE